MKYNPFWWLMNDDDPICPSDKFTDDYGIIREIKWLARNPLHNFFFYVIGWADKVVMVFGPLNGTLFNPKGGWNFHKIKKFENGRLSKLSLPFISYISENRKFYIGWRERGNFGFKFTRNKDITIQKGE